MSIFDHDLDRTTANHVPLSPVSFLVRAARTWPDRIAIIHGERRYTYAQFLERTRRLASALARAGIGKGDTVAILAPNIPEMLEVHNAGKSLLVRETFEKAEHYVHQLQGYSLHATMEREELQQAIFPRRQFSEGFST